jgi:alkyl hydroperoxide reductase subunit AhpF
MNDNQELESNAFDAETWEQLPALLGHLPQPVHLVVWGDETAAQQDQDAVILCQTLAEHFGKITFQQLPRRVNYDYWPVIGVMQGTAENWQDLGLRMIGLPNGYQMTSLITAVQAVSFRGMTSEATTRIKLTRLAQEVSIELITAADNEAGALMAHPLFNMAVVSPHIRVYMIMADQFPAIVHKYSVSYLPHTVMNGRVHIEGVVDEDAILQHIGKAVLQ